MSEARFERFVERVCENCVNWHEGCDDFHSKHPKCYWTEDFLEAEELFRKLDELDDYYEHLADVTPEDEYDYEAEENAFESIEKRLDELERAFFHDVQDDIVAYCRYYAYEM